MRETRSQLSVFEVVPGTDQVQPCVPLGFLSRPLSLCNLQGGGGIYRRGLILRNSGTHWYLIWAFTFLEGGRDLEGCCYGLPRYRAGAVRRAWRTCRG